MYTLEDFENDKSKMLEFIEENGGCKNWVLKPQHEGGGQNYFGDSIMAQIEISSPAQCAAVSATRVAWPCIPRAHDHTVNNHGQY